MRAPLLCAAFALAAYSLAGCDSSGPTPADPAQLAYEQASDAAYAAVRAAIGDARAGDVAACRLLPLGVNNAGGATGYGVYSVTDGDPARILSLAERVADIDRQAIADGVLNYPHPTPPPPVVELRDGRCLFEPVVVVN